MKLTCLKSNFTIQSNRFSQTLEGTKSNQIKEIIPNPTQKIYIFNHPKLTDSLHKQFKNGTNKILHTTSNQIIKSTTYVIKKDPQLI